jgi:hypothetical protein
MTEASHTTQIFRAHLHTREGQRDVREIESVRPRAMPYVVAQKGVELKAGVLGVRARGRCPKGCNARQDWPSPDVNVLVHVIVNIPGPRGISAQDLWKRHHAYH